MIIMIEGGVASLGDVPGAWYRGLLPGPREDTKSAVGMRCEGEEGKDSKGAIVG